MSQSSAYLLVSHGSRDPRPQAAIAQLAQRVQHKMQSDTPLALVGAAVLECAPLPLHEQIQQFSQTAIAQNVRHIQIVPLFLIPGVHVMEDIPEQVKIAQQTLGETVTIALSPHIGTHPGMENLLANRLAQRSADAYILMSHGSRRSGGNQSVETLASKIGAVSAYWSVAPKLEARLQELAQSGHQKIAILPYFLFTGGIIGTIAQAVDQLSQQFPNLELDLATPLEVSDRLADLVLDLSLQSPKEITANPSL
ncbi:sirohydrochlorin chelatase [Phormidesmis priestleyi ULC007]|uniref:Sirohydrochlorin chelatase n=1 Tax=Phormidesmis priestleyi ULC007 TaxID=1920490 RepID=A0A2T1DLJ2_9CYAN|nr:sirohydrochlorin chelatase [Phormidesmis priestleyi]PSB21325.1 sirohydrochlorin chelatase [Phormidesmis priestleyi ULC007]PZO51382.1 MAG: sirohydrochlorin chelatase [Phormidesmis priestleyi]